MLLAWEHAKTTGMLLLLCSNTQASSTDMQPAVWRPTSQATLLTAVCMTHPHKPTSDHTLEDTRKLRTSQSSSDDSSLIAKAATLLLIHQTGVITKCPHIVAAHAYLAMPGYIYPDCPATYHTTAAHMHHSW